MIQINDLAKSYTKSKPVLNHLDLKIAQGEIFGLLGVNGAGKTTLIKIMVGLQSAESGTIILNGKSMTDDELETKKSFYYMPDNYDVYRCITGLEWIEFVLNIYGSKHNNASEKIRELSDLFEITDDLNRKISTYSLGMRNKLGIMIGFIIHPPILILDEPMHGLDPYSIIAYRNLLKDYSKQGGTVLYSTHLIDLAQKICTRVGILHKGEIKKIYNSNDLSRIKDLEKEFMEVTDNGADI